MKIANKSSEEMIGIVDMISDLKIGENRISKIKVLQLAQVSNSINEELNEMEEFTNFSKK